MPKFDVTIVLSDDVQLARTFDHPTIADCLRRVAAIIDEQRSDLATDMEPSGVGVVVSGEQRS